MQYILTCWSKPALTVSDLSFDALVPHLLANKSSNRGATLHKCQRQKKGSVAYRCGLGESRGHRVRGMLHSGAGRLLQLLESRSDCKFATAVTSKQAKKVTSLDSKS